MAREQDERRVVLVSRNWTEVHEGEQVRYLSTTYKENGIITTTVKSEATRRAYGLYV